MKSVKKNLWQMLAYAIALGVCFTLTSCTHTVLGQMMTEQVVVEDKVFTPATHGGGLGYSFAGKGGPVYVNVDTEPVYAVVFRCQHGSFIVQREDVWRQVAKGDTLTCFYQEKYAVDNDHPEQQALVGYHFDRVEPVR